MFTSLPSTPGSGTVRTRSCWTEYESATAVGFAMLIVTSVSSEKHPSKPSPTQYWNVTLPLNPAAGVYVNPPSSSRPSVPELTGTRRVARAPIGRLVSFPSTPGAATVSVWSTRVE